jgi:anti-sigma-K factor RskA
MRDHAAIEELIALRALDGLDPADERELAAQRSDHGASCAECLRLESDYDEVAGRLAFALAPAEIRDGLEDEIVSAARGEHRDRSVAAPGSLARAETRGTTAREHDRRRFATPMRALAAVVAAVLIVAAGIGGYLLAPRPDTVAEALARTLQQPDTRSVELSGSAPGAMKVVYAPGTSDAFVVGSGLEQAPSGKSYELWRFEGQKPVSTGCFSPGANGEILREVNADLSGANAVAITIESAACPAAPTSQPVMTGEL